MDMDSKFTDIDIVSGRGQGIQRLPGNVMFRKLVSAHKRTYAQAPKTHKVKVSKGIVTALRKFGAKFLEFDTKAGCYYDIGDEKAISKTGQALREGQTKIKQELAAEMKDNINDSKRSSIVTTCSTSSNISVEESYARKSILVFESMRLGQELDVENERQAPQKPSSSEQDTDSRGQGLSKFLLDLSNSGSDRSFRAIHALFKDKIASEKGLPAELLTTTDEEITDMLNEMDFDFDLDEMDLGAP